MGVAIFFLIPVLFLGCEGTPNGAPLSACSTLTPEHRGIAPQRTASPYAVSVSKHGNTVRVKLFSSVGEKFEGFVLQARYSNNRNRAVDGFFTTENGVTKTIDCFNGKRNTLTFISPSPKQEVVTDWTPNTALDQDIIFRATFAKTFSEFYTEVDSSPVKIVNDGPSGNPSARKLDGNSKSRIYMDCSVSKGCFGLPSGCINREDCEVLLSYSSSKDGVSFEMHGTLDDNEYMAMGLSEDNLMGEDVVTQCVRMGTRLTAQRSWNVKNDKDNNVLYSIEPSAYASEFTNGLSSCSFAPSVAHEANMGRVFNLVNDTFYILLAKGPMRDRRLSYHSRKGSTQQPVDFSAFQVSEAEGVTNSIKIHGTFMVTAYLGLFSIGILIARHFKPSWERTMCGVKIWFALHRGLMLVALAFVAVAFIVIFVHKDGWNYETDNPHAILGCVATVLAFLQPIMAFFRPGPDHPKRPIFNALHFTVGNAAQLIAIIAIFYARTLESSGLDDNFYAVVAAFVIVYLLFHLFFQVHTLYSERKRNSEVKMINMANRGSNAAQNDVPEKNLVNQALRKIFLGIYTIFVVAILIALYALIGSA